MSSHWNKSLREQMEMIENLYNDFEGSKERLLDVIGEEDQAPIYTKSLAVYNHEPRHRNLTQASESEHGIQCW